MSGSFLFTTSFNFLLILITYNISCVVLAPAIGEMEAIMYFHRFGYITIKNSTKTASLNRPELNKTISEFQRFAGLKITGNLDSETVHMMSLPRCGVKDFESDHNSFRLDRFVLQGSKWNKTDIKYKIFKYPRHLNITDVNIAIKEAFKVWRMHTSLTFTQIKDGRADIQISFEKGQHGDEDSFDGPDGTLAHAFFPEFGGDVHFDDAERWTFKSMRGVNLLQVAAHEFGHSLGLRHSDVPATLMAPFYRKDLSVQLDEDDILAMHNLYGWCSNIKIDTILKNPNGNTYIFKNEVFYKISKKGITNGYPKRISKRWKGLPGKLDAAFTNTKGKTYFFKKNKFWRYDGHNLDAKYPKHISNGFPGIPNNIDAAFSWFPSNKVYFIKGNQYWIYDFSKDPRVKSVFPKNISGWDGVSNNIDAALRTKNGNMYIFKDDGYYMINNKTFEVLVRDPPYPKSIGQRWFGCE